MTTTVTADIEVDVPVRVAYDQWTQFESFPEFLGGVDSVRQIDDVMTQWTVSIGGVKREFDAEIGDQVPDDHVTWRSVGEVVHNGRVDFRALGAERTRIDLTIEWEPEGFVEEAGAALQLDDLQVRSDLKRFKDYIEERRTPTGAWRGEIHGGEPTVPDQNVSGSATPRDPFAQPGEGLRGSDADLL
ncbi:SRPBCC family protein [Agromyces sp. ISL-38]|uniref:SRPBCC family protein n=1 Tax=Agromyces sp. ISL-38 TaxID=2819107 RepID=UPI001BEBDCB9|nr:SRPBCC family protein [Agromyces sp. ISL-38]MBT2500667.1 SRPBCC family protein [Agromyces sp. ISL-38]